MNTTSSYPVISLFQPWASLTAIGARPFDYRIKTMPKALIGKRVAIHAASRDVDLEEIRDLYTKLKSPEAAMTGLDAAKAIPFLEMVLADPKCLPRSAIIALATLGTPIRNQALERALGMPVLNDADREDDTLWGWPLLNVEKLSVMVPAVGTAKNWTIELSTDFEESSRKIADEAFEEIGKKAAFRRLFNQWKEEVGPRPSVEAIVAHPAYHHILAMGNSAVEDIITEMRTAPATWMPVLGSILVICSSVRPPDYPLAKKPFPTTFTIPPAPSMGSPNGFHS